MTSKDHPQHDRFFRAAMMRRPMYEGFLKQHLPAEIKALIDFDHIEPTKETFVESDLKAMITDVLFRTHLGDDTGYLYVLVEHQSQPDRWMPFRVWKYVFAIMDYHLQKTKDNHLPLVYPLVFYNGKAPYRYSLDMIALYPKPLQDLARSIFLKDIRFIDVSRMDDARFKRTFMESTFANLAQLIMKHIHDHDLIPTYLDLIPLMKHIEEEPLGKEFVILAHHYILAHGQAQDAGKIIEIAVQSLSREIGADVMTIAEALKKEAFKEGEQQKAEQIALRLLTLDVDTDVIVSATGLSTDQINALRDDSKTTTE